MGDNDYLISMEVDLTKPRRRLIRHSVFQNKEFEKFKKAHPEYLEKVPNISKFKELIYLVHEEAALEMQRNPYGVILPENFAVLFINNKGTSKKPLIDYNMSKKLKTVVFHRNIGTEFNRMRIMYLNKTLPTNVRNNHLYALITQKDFRKKCSDYFKEHWNICITYTNRNR